MNEHEPSIPSFGGVGFPELAGSILAGGHRVRFQAGGASMQPFIHDGDILEVAPLAGRPARRGDILMVQTGEGRLLVHRLVKTRRRAGLPEYCTQGDACPSADGWFQAGQALGRVTAVEHTRRRIGLTSPAQRFKAWLWVAMNPILPRITWLPKNFRRLVLKGLFGSMISDY